MLNRSGAKIRQLLLVLFVALGLSACASSTETADIGVEPSLGVAVTAFRDEPIVTSDLDVLGTVQVSELPEESAIEVPEESSASEASRRGLMWAGVIGLVLLSFAMTGAARVSEARVKK